VTIGREGLRRGEAFLADGYSVRASVRPEFFSGGDIGAARPA